MLVIDNPVVMAIKALYGVVSNINDFVDTHIEALKRSANETMRATGRVLEGAKFGFGIGYSTPLIITAIGQMILGNTLSAAATIASGLVLTNPLAMTCGAIGALYYGWKALSEDERNAIVERIQAAFDVGVELVKAMAGYVLSALGEFLSSEKLESFKAFISDSARSFGHTLGDVTRSVVDRVSDAYGSVTGALGSARDGAEGLLEDAKRSAKSVLAGRAVAKVIDDEVDRLDAGRSGRKE